MADIPRSNRVGRSQIIEIKLGPPPPGPLRKGKTMAQREKEARRRFWLLISATLMATLAIGVLLGWMIPH